MEKIHTKFLTSVVTWVGKKRKGQDPSTQGLKGTLILLLFFESFIHTINILVYTHYTIKSIKSLHVYTHTHTHTHTCCSMPGQIVPGKMPSFIKKTHFKETNGHNLKK